MLEQYDDILTTDEACEVLRVGYNAIYALLNSGKLKGYRNGHTWRIPKISVEQYVLESANLKNCKNVIDYSKTR